MTVLSPEQPNIGNIPTEVPKSGIVVGHVYPIEQGNAQSLSGEYANHPHTVIKTIVSDSFQMIKFLVNGIGEDEAVSNEASNSIKLQDENGNPIPSFRAFADVQDQSAAQIGDLSRQISGSDTPDFATVKAATTIIMGGLLLDSQGGFDRRSIKALSNIIGSELNYIKANPESIQGSSVDPYAIPDGGSTVTIPDQSSTQTPSTSFGPPSNEIIIPVLA